MANIREEIDKWIATKLTEESSLIEMVTRQFVGVDLESGSLQGISRHEMPAVIVNSGNETRDGEGRLGRINMVYNPEIVGYVHDQDEYFTKLNDLITDVKQIIFSNANVVYGTECIALIRGINVLRIDRGRLAPLAVFALELDVRYSYLVTTGGALT